MDANHEANDDNPEMYEEQRVGQSDWDSGGESDEEYTLVEMKTTLVSAVFIQTPPTCTKLIKSFAI